MYRLTIEGPDAEHGKEDFETRNRTTAYNVFKRLAYRNRIVMVEPGGTVLDSEIQPDPWEVSALA